MSDFILVRSSGMPVYNYVVTIDDALMRITHVIRGDDHISNTPRQVAIYQAFGWRLPQFAHLSTILGSDRERLVEAPWSHLGGQLPRNGNSAPGAGELSRPARLGRRGRNA